MLSALIRFNLRVLLNPPPHKSVSSLHIAESTDRPRKVIGWLLCVFRVHYHLSCGTCVLSAISSIHPLFLLVLHRVLYAGT